MKRKYKILFIILLILGIGLLLPQRFTMPVKDGTSSSYNHNSYWYYPWGKSGTHKGVDIFAKKGTTLLSSTSVLYTGTIERGGKVVAVLGPKWRIHYYAHLQEIETSTFSFLSGGENIGRVGDTGNAKGKPPHVHYAIITLLPYVWRVDSSIQGWKKMFYLNPIDYLKAMDKP